MKKRSVSSRSAAREKTKKRSTLAGRRNVPEPPMITAAEFDRLADMPPYLDLSNARRPGREVQRVNVDFPVDLLRAIDREARRIGVTRQAFIKLRLADTLSSSH